MAKEIRSRTGPIIALLYHRHVRLAGVHVGGEIGGGGRQGRAARGQPQTVQNFSLRVGRMYCGQNFHPSAASFTRRTSNRKTLNTWQIATYQGESKTP